MFAVATERAELRDGQAETQQHQPVTLPLDYRCDPKKQEHRARVAAIVL